MMNMGSVLKAVEGLKKEVAEWSEVVKKAEIGFRKDVEDMDADGEEEDEDEDEEEKKGGSDREESQKDAEDVAGEVVGQYSVFRPLQIFYFVICKYRENFDVLSFLKCVKSEKSELAENVKKVRVNAENKIKDRKLVRWCRASMKSVAE